MHNGTGLFIAGSKGDIAGGEAAKCHAKPADHREGNWISLDPTALKPSHEQDENAVEQPARKAAAYAADGHDRPGAAKRQNSRSRTEISIVAKDCERGNAGGDDTANDEAACADFEGTAQFLDAENDSGKRGVEGGGDPRRSAGHEQPRLIENGDSSSDGRHDRRVDLNRRSFATDRRAAEKRERQEDDLARRCLQGDEREAVLFVGQLARRDNLRNAAALRIGKDFAREECRKAKAARRQDEGGEG